MAFGVFGLRAHGFLVFRLMGFWFLGIWVFDSGFWALGSLVLGFSGPIKKNCTLFSLLGLCIMVYWVSCLLVYGLFSIWPVGF